jgi:hypothetical protein
MTLGLRCAEARGVAALLVAREQVSMRRQGGTAAGGAGAGRRGHDAVAGAGGLCSAPGDGAAREIGRR